MPPRGIADRSDYIAPYDPHAVVVHRDRRFCALPKPKRDLTLESHVAMETTRLLRRWLHGVGWDRRRLTYSVAEIIRRVWSVRQHTSLAGDPYVHEVLRRAKVQDPYCIRKGSWTYRYLTAMEMRRVVKVAAHMRAQVALGREDGRLR